MSNQLVKKLNDEEGHAAPLPGLLVAAAGMIALGIGAANGTGWLCVAGGIAGAVGVVATDVLNHVSIDYNIFGRLEKLERKE